MRARDAGRQLTGPEILELVPHRRPFRFIDEILEVSSDHIVGRYTYRQDEFFYAGHFPGHPVTPGVILEETMTQTGVVALGIFLFALEAPLEEVGRHRTLYTEGSSEFYAMVSPGETVTATARKVFWRRKKLKSEVELTMANGQVAAAGVFAGMGVTDDRI